MTTVVNTPAPVVQQAAPADNSGNGMGMVVGLFVLIILGALFFMYGLPAIKQMQVSTPQVAPQINIPDKIDVNIDQTP